MAKVLVVEDDPDIRTLLVARIRQMGHRVLAVGTGEDALSLVADKGAPDVAVLDVRMPGMSGLDLLTRLRESTSYASTPTIFLSGRVQEADIDAGKALGAAYLTKPLVLSALGNAITQALQPADAGESSW